MRRLLIVAVVTLTALGLAMSAQAQPLTTPVPAPSVSDTQTEPTSSVTTSPSGGSRNASTTSAPTSSVQRVPEPTPQQPSSRAASNSTTAAATPTDASATNGKKIPYTGKPTENPNATVVPGKMRSDREEIPAPFTKADADKAETMEAQATTSRSALAADCQRYWPAPYDVCGAIRDKYNSLGAQFSFLLLPTSGELVNPDGFGRRQTFQNGPIYWSGPSGAHPVVNHFFAAWQRQGWEGGILGYPTTDEIPAANSGRRQEFQGAAIYWHFNEAYAIGGAIREKWNTAGAEGGPLGYPTSDEVAVSKYNGRFNNFEQGAIYWSNPTQAHSIDPDILAVYRFRGSEAGRHGFPTSDTFRNGLYPGWVDQTFELDDISYYRPF